MSRIENLSGKLTILVVEDNVGDFVLIEDFLQEKFIGVQIEHQLDFEQAVEFLQSTDDEVSLILLDLHLPDHNGVDLIQRMLKYNFQIPVVVLTGYSDIEMAKKSLQLGVYDYLIKDEINPVVLEKTIVFAINRSGFIHQIEAEKVNYENLFNFNPQPTWVLERETLKIVNANIAAQRKYGIPLKEFQNMAFYDLHPDEEKSLIHNNILSRNTTTNTHYTHILRGGKRLKVDVCFEEIRNNDQEGIIVQSNDISNTLAHIETIESQNTKLRDIAWTQSHIVRAPLSRILGIINMIEDQNLNFAEVKEWLKQLKTSSNELDDVVKRIVEEINEFEKS